MERGSTFFLRAAVIALTLAVLAFFGYAAWALRFENLGKDLPFVIGVFASTLPFFFAVFQALKLLRYVDTGTAFSTASVQALSAIKVNVFIFSGMYAAATPYAYIMAQQEDAPGVLALVLVVAFASCAVGVFAAVLQRLLNEAIRIKSENDLTV